MSLFITDLKPARGSTHRTKRRGRGTSSGRGKTCGRGTKGFLARSGGVRDPGFEGGQMPLILRVPKRGFNSRFGVRYAIVNLADLDQFDAGTPVTPAMLDQAGLVHGHDCLVKVLGDGDCTKPLHVVAHKFSKSAAEKLAKAGGRAEIYQAPNAEHRTPNAKP